MPRFATDEEAGIFAALRMQIASHHHRNRLRTQYAEAERLIEHLDLPLPSNRTIEQTPLHWPAKSIEVFSSRLTPAFFSMRLGADLLEDLRKVWADSSVDLAEKLAIRSALRHGPAFVFTSRGDTSKGEPAVIVSAQSALTATCDIDPRTRRVTAALELLEGREANLYLPGRTLYVQAGASRLLVIEDHPSSQRIHCAPFIHDMTLDKPFGSSRISRPVMGFTDAAVRTFMRQEVSAEWYSAPRERILGASAEQFEDGPGWLRSVVGAVDVLPDIHEDDDPAVPDSLRRAEIHTLPQMTMQPFSDQFRLIASQFSGASSIPLQYLGIVQDSNPTSAEAIEAQDVDLVRAVRDQYMSFNFGRLLLARNIIDLALPDADTEALRTLSSRWEDPRVRGIREHSAFVASQVNAGNFQPGTRETLELLPITAEEAALHAEANRRAGGASLMEKILERAGQAEPTAEAVADGSAVDTPVEPSATEDMRAARDRFEALGLGVRAGLDQDWVADYLGLEGAKFSGTPVSVRGSSEARTSSADPA